MSKVLLFTLSIFWNLHAFAEVEKRTTEDLATEIKNSSSPFETLGQWIEGAELITLEELSQGDLTSMRYGRCFYPHDSKLVRGSLLFTVEDKRLGDAFDNPVYVVAATHRYAEAYDNYSYTKETHKEWRELLIYQYDNWIESRSSLEGPDFQTGTPLSATRDFEPNGNIDLRLEVRRYNDLIVLDGVNLIDQDYYSEYLRGYPHRYTYDGRSRGVYLKSGESAVRCYYFGRVTAKDSN